MTIKDVLRSNGDGIRQPTPHSSQKIGRTFQAFVELKRHEGFTIQDTLRARYVQYTTETGFFNSLKNILLGAGLGYLMIDHDGSEEQNEAFLKEIHFYRQMVTLQQCYDRFHARPSSHTYEAIFQIFRELHELSSTHGIAPGALHDVMHRHMGCDVLDHFARYELTKNGQFSASNLIDFLDFVDGITEDPLYGDGVVVRDAMVRVFRDVVMQNHEYAHTVWGICQSLAKVCDEELVKKICKGHPTDVLLQRCIPEDMIHNAQELANQSKALAGIEAQLDAARTEKERLGQVTFSFTSKQVQAIFGDGVPSDIAEKIQQAGKEIHGLQDSFEKFEQEWVEKQQHLEEEYNTARAEAERRLFVEQIQLKDAVKHLGELGAKTPSQNETDNVHKEMDATREQIGSYVQKVKDLKEEILDLEERFKQEYHQIKKDLDSVINVAFSWKESHSGASHAVSIARIVTHSVTLDPLSRLDTYHREVSTIRRTRDRYQNSCTQVEELELAQARCEASVQELQGRLKCDDTVLETVQKRRQALMTRIARMSPRM